ncbi:hypothetical protein [Agromyces sp. Root81]|uniref:hypothetical protein n=1 Tax=Agromyces sp. Root81 TaxID=1736601 RepID=UPI0012F7DFB6|nr:hypothetical protein [Agromyces sp. Root81]
MPRSSALKPARAFRPASDPFKIGRPVPVAVQVGFWTLLLLSIIQAVTVVWSLAVFDWDGYMAEWVHSFERDGQELQVTPEIAIATVVFGVVVSAISIALRVAFTLLLRRGFNWARIVATVLFGALLLPPYILDGIAILVMALAIAGIVLVWLPQSNAFFRDVKQDRIAHKAKQFS